ncbi:DUF6541 family protein [Candidatus Chloroploca sp. Khr17]|uniref:DUF6541 family protein n=1 Tax=Candidatus Chloroploca sp. Khr17 TaxID=2496869 RepID=UPI00101C5CB6|nr:DUF6541 family protein [Candidatus Chloroploca sp. Khr17]
MQSVVQELRQQRRLLVVGVVLALVAGLAAPQGRLVVSMAALLVAPGYLVERYLVRASLPWLPRLTIWLGLSVSLVALLYQWLWPLGLPVSAPMLWAGSLLLGLAALVTVWRGRNAVPPSLALPSPQWPLMALLTLAVFGFTFLQRMAEIDGVALPPWVDSVHHTLLVRIAVETGLAPHSLEPYLPVNDLPYHWGYHVVIATLVRLSEVAPVDAILLTGQIFNALHTLTVASLALVLWRRPVAAPVAALVVGLLSLMPAYYLSWGRYTQLVGLLMLPGLALVWHQALRGNGRGWWVLVALLMAGLSLVHMRVVFFAGALLVAQTLLWASTRPWPVVRIALRDAFAATVAAGILTLPWIMLLVRRTLLPAATSGTLAGNEDYNALNQGLLWVDHTRLLVALALSSALIGLWYRQRVAAIVALWVGLLVVMANPWLVPYLLPATGLVMLLNGLRIRHLALSLVGLGLLVLNPFFVRLPYLWLLTNDAVVISLFLPLAVLIGGGAALVSEQLVSMVRPVLRPALYATGLVGLVAAGIWGTQTMSEIPNTATLLATPADRMALDWVATNTPPEARFLVNAAPWLPAARRGVDGGWWLSPLAGRWTTVPPVLFSYGDPAYVAHMHALGDRIINHTPENRQDIFALIASESITHIYLVEGRGPLQPTLFANAPGFRQIYARDGVVIFAVE